MKKQNNSNEDLHFFTIKDTQVILKVSRSTLYRMRIEKKIRFKKIGGSIRFSAEDIKKAMK